MHSTSLAPLLSATRSRDSCWITVLPPTSRFARSLGPLQHFDDTPALVLAEWPGLHDANLVADVGIVRLVVGVQPLRAHHELAVLGVTNAFDDRDDGGLVHLVGDDKALPGLAVPPRFGFS